MNEDPRESPDQQLSAIADSARRLGIELDEAEARQWLDALSSWRAQDALQVDNAEGVFGHRVVMLDFDPQDLARFREIGELVGIGDRPGVVESALALSGSAAQSKIQTFPGDCDYFERVNIRAATREAACAVLGEVMREKALATLQGPTYRLLEVKLGSYPAELVVDGKLRKSGSPIAWRADQVVAGEIAAFTPAGEAVTLRWAEVAQQPGWCKLDWVVADPVRRRLANASNMLDATWEAPDGAIYPLDGYLDPYFQEVYLEAQDVPIFSKLVRHVSPDALDDYVGMMEREIRKYLYKDVNLGKAAKRMYNMFRLTGRYTEAAYLRELFDEPATLLYQIWSLIRTIDEACDPGTGISMDYVIQQMDQLIMDVVNVLEGKEESEVIRSLLVLRDMLARQETGEQLTVEAEGARQRVINLVNNFFRDRLTAMPQINDYMEGLKE